MAPNARRGPSRRSTRRPLPARRRRRILTALALPAWPLLLALASAPWAARADTSPLQPPDAPRFTFVDGSKPEAEWKAKAQLGAASSTGNSTAVSVSASASVARRSGNHQLSADASAAFARTQILVATEQDGIPGIGPGELRTLDQTTTQAWSLGLRYDRFFAQRNSVYLAAGAAADRPAGKKLLAGGQVGYRRILYGTPKRQLAAELGYDLTRREYVGPGDPIQVHSGRLFLGWKAEPDPLFGLEVSAEYLTNLAPEATPTGRVAALHDDRIGGLLGAMVKFSTHGTLGLRFAARYDTAPAPRPAPAGASYEAGFLPLADRLDTRTELVLGWQLP